MTALIVLNASSVVILASRTAKLELNAVSRTEFKRSLADIATIFRRFKHVICVFSLVEALSQDFLD